MIKNYNFILTFCLFGLMSSLSFSQTTYNGNGNTGFSGTLGNGSLVIDDDGTNLSFQFTEGSDFNDIMVIYFDSETSGFTDTTTFTDDSDGGRSAVSTRNGDNNPTINFPTGFEADYAMAVGNSFSALFDLVSGGPHNFVAGANFSGASPTYTVSLPFSALNLSSVDSFDFVVSYISGSAFLSNEVIGATDPIPDNPGFTGTITFTAANTYPNTLSVLETTLDEVVVFSENGLLNLKGLKDSRYNLNLYDLNGRKLLQQEFTGDQIIPVNTMSSGVYILQLASNGLTMTRKFVLN